MTALPNEIARYTGANAFSAQDAAGNAFYVFQKQNDTGLVVMVYPNGVAREVLSLPSKSGRPSLECNPLVGLWAVGNKESGSRATPPRYPIIEYVPFERGVTSVAIPPDGAIAALYQGVYAPADLDTPQEVALRVSKQLAALNELVDLLKAAGVLV